MQFFGDTNKMEYLKSLIINGATQISKKYYDTPSLIFTKIKIKIIFSDNKNKFSGNRYIYN